MADIKATQNTRYYTAVMHTPELTQVHNAVYSEDGTPLAIAPKPEKLEDVTPEHLINFLAQVAVGLTNKTPFDAAQFAELSAKYESVCAAEQVAENLEIESLR